MASISAKRNAYATLVANTVDIVTFPFAYGSYEVVNRGTTDLFVRSDGSNPAVNTDGSDLVQAGTAVSLVNERPGSALEVRLLSAGTPAYAVTAG